MFILKNVYVRSPIGPAGPIGHALVPYPVANLVDGRQADHQDLLAEVWLGEGPAKVWSCGWARPSGSCMN